MIRSRPDGVEVAVWAQPNGKKSEILGKHGDYIKIRLHAPPVDGAANEELIRFLSQVLKVSRSSIQIIKGATDRRKLVFVTGITVEKIAEYLAP